MAYKRYRSEQFDEDGFYLRAHPHEIIEMDMSQLEEPKSYEDGIKEEFKLDLFYLDLLGPSEDGEWYRVRFNDPETPKVNAKLTGLLRRD